MAKKHRYTDLDFCVMCAVRGFDMKAFDSWLSQLGTCGAKTELLERRQKAFDAFQKTPDQPDAYLRHLEWMHLRMKTIQRDDVVLPMARKQRDDQRNNAQQLSKARDNLSKSRRAASEENRAIAKKEINKLFKSGAGWDMSDQDVCKKVGRNFVGKELKLSTFLKYFGPLITKAKKQFPKP